MESPNVTTLARDAKMVLDWGMAAFLIARGLVVCSVHIRVDFFAREA
jgi:hypothetical protein